MKFIATVTMAAVIGLTSVIPVQAGPIAIGQFARQSNVETVQYYRERRGHWNGHRGHRERRRGYRRHSDGWWYPLAAFGAGAIIGGAISSDRGRGGRAHVRWCANQYRSYDIDTDSYLSYDGGWRRCNSPY